MAFKSIELRHPNAQIFHKELLWVNKDCNCYFAFKLNDGDAWTFFAGNASHALATGKLLTSYGTSEANAQTNYLTTIRDASGKVVAVLPVNFQAKYARVYIQDGNSTTVYEWQPSSYFTAHEIISGTLEITDLLSDAPLIKVVAGAVDRIKMGKVGSYYGLFGYDGSGNSIFELSDNQQKIAGYTVTTSALYAGTGATRIQLDTTAGIHLGATAFASAPFRVSLAGALTATSATITGTVNATAGYFGDGVTRVAIEAAGINIGNTGSIRGGQTAYNTGTGFFMGYSGGEYKFSFGNPVGNYVTWDGTILTYYKGVIEETIIKMYTSVASLRTSATAGDGSANSSGIVVTYEGIFGCGANQTATVAAANANVRILNDGSAYFKGAITATSGSFTGMISGSYVYGSSLMTKGTYLAASCGAGDATLSVGDTTDFPASGSASFIDSANDCDTFTYTGKTGTTLTGCSGVLVHTVSVSNKPLVVPEVKGMYISDASNDMKFYGDRGDGKIEELASIGITGSSGVYRVANFGGANCSHYALVARSKSAPGLYGISTNHYGVYGDSENDNGVYGFSLNSDGIKGHTHGPGRYAVNSDGDTRLGGNSVILDGAWLGLGAAKGRIQFDDETVDTISLLDCNVGIGTGVYTPATKLHIIDDTYGGLRISDNESPGAAKYGAITGSQQASDTEPEGFLVVGMGGEAGDNHLFIGGGYGQRNAITSLAIYTAEDTITRIGTLRMRINSLGYAIFGSIMSPPNTQCLAAGADIAVEKARPWTSIANRAYYNGISGGGALVLAHSRSDLVGTLTETQSTDTLGFIAFEGVNSSSASALGSYIQAKQAGAAGATYIPSYMSFYTSTNAAVPERMRITSTGVVTLDHLGELTASHNIVCDNVINMSAGFKAFGAENLKIWTYTHTLTATDVAGTHIHFTVTSVTRTKIRLFTCTYHPTASGRTRDIQSAVQAGYLATTGAYFMSDTDIEVDLGASKAENDIISITIIEAI